MCLFHMMIPHHARDLPENPKYTKIISINGNILAWAVPDMGAEITLYKHPLNLKFKVDNQRQDQKIKKLIQDHFNEMKKIRINEDACEKLKVSFYNSHEIDGTDIITYNSMSLLHFFGT